MTQLNYGDVVHVSGAPTGATVLVVCEHASNRVPDCLDNLGLDAETLQSHAAWDPGALGVAQAITDKLNGTLVYGGVSRLVYDCNRPPEALSAMPERSEKYDIAGNKDMSVQDRMDRVENVYRPFSDAVSGQIRAQRSSLELLVTVHSFTPVFGGRHRDVELGILHGLDERFTDAMMATLDDSMPFDTRLNQPYAAPDGVAHTLDQHGMKNGLLNVMIEVRNDLIETPEQQNQMAEHLVPWLARTLQKFLSGEIE